MHPRSFLFAALCFVTGCNALGAELSPAEDALVAAVNMDRGIALAAKSSGQSIERLNALTPDFDQAPANGILVVTKPKQGRKALTEIRSRLVSTPYHAYLYDNSFGYGPDRVAVLQNDDYGYLAIVRTDGINYDLDHEKVIERYKAWDKKYGLKLVGAGQDWLEAEFSNPPNDWQAFAKEVYEFCPDVVDQGTGDVASLAKEMQESNTLYLWWD